MDCSCKELVNVITEASSTPLMDNDLSQQEICLLRLGNCSRSIQEAILGVPDELRRNKDFILAAVNQNGSVLQFASEELRGDKDVVLAAVAQKGLTLRSASEQLRGDKDVVLVAVVQNGSALMFASAKLKGDKEVMLAAVAQNGSALLCASTELKRDKEVVLAAVAKNGPSLMCASSDLKGDKDVVLTAVAQNGYSLEYASQELKRDKEMVLMAVAWNGFTLMCASAEMRGSKEVVLMAVAQNGFSLRYASEGLRGDKEVILAAVGSPVPHQGSVLNFVSAALCKKELYEWIQDRLQVHDALMLFLLATRPRQQPGESQGRFHSEVSQKLFEAVPRDEASALRLINSLGNDDASAGTAVKRLVAGYLGAHCGAVWRNFVSASRKLEKS
jgi:predicted methyltransferase